MLGVQAESEAAASAEPPDEEGGYDSDDDDDQFVEVDPTGRYGRYVEVLGRGASKTVFRAFDKVDGIEVAWNQVWLKDGMEGNNELKHIQSEVELLKMLKHKNIIKLYASWFDHKKCMMNFITELSCSGTLREFRQKHKHVDLKAIKNWATQILRGLVYLHGQDPPIIHRDLKCDNIFVNGNTGQIKIGDLGFATVLKKCGAPLSVHGTPEFMAPELYQEDYNELVDIYSFGMCVLEMVTLDFPYSECKNVAQIYKRVITGIHPLALNKVKGPQVRLFIEKCLAPACHRLSARELLKDQFLQSEDKLESGRSHGQEKIRPGLDSFQNGQAFQNIGSSTMNLMTIPNQLATLSFCGHNTMGRGIGIQRDIRVKGILQDERTVYLKFRIAESRNGEPYVRNIQCLFDLEVDTSWNVAKEMVQELNFADQDLAYLANAIGAEITSLAPEWNAHHWSFADQDFLRGEDCGSEHWQEAHNLSSEERQDVQNENGSQIYYACERFHESVPTFLKAFV